MIEEIGLKDNAQKDDSKAKDNEINFSGKITLPEKQAADGGADAGAAGGDAAAGAKKPSDSKAPAKKPGGNAPVKK